MYWAGLHGPFLFDDFPNLAALDSIGDLGGWRDLGIYLSQPRSLPGRPLAMLSFLLQKSSWPGDPFAFKLVNLCIHLANGVLVFFLAKRLGGVFLIDRGDRHSATWPALLAAAAWLICPIQLSAILLVVQRMTLLMALFTLLGLLAYLQALLDDQASIRRRTMFMAIGLGACTLLALLSKENGILLPFYALALDATLLRERVRRLPPVLAWLRRALIYPAVIFVLGYLLVGIPGFAHAESFRDFTLYQRVITEPRILADYLEKIFLPRFGVYGLYNDDFAKSNNLFDPLSTTLCLALLLVAVGLAFHWRKRRPLFALAVFWYLGGQVLESSVVMLELYFEHRNYLPVTGPLIAIAIALATLRPGSWRKLAYMGVAIWFGASVIATSLSAQVWASEERLAFTWGNTHPDSTRAQTMLASQLYGRGQPGAATRVIDRALGRHPGDAGLAENKFFLRCTSGSLAAEDLTQLRDTLRTADWNRSAFENMETLRLLAQQHRCPPFDPQQWKALADTLLANPAYRGGIAAGMIHYQISQFAVYNGDLGLAVAELDQAYAADPDADIPRLQARYLASAGLYDEAIAILDHADYKRLPLLRRLLVDDRAINRERAEAIRNKKAGGQHRPGPQADQGKTAAH
jgi:tetratricopeptide (TPR) repeat protein